MMRTHCEAEAEVEAESGFEDEGLQTRLNSNSLAVLAGRVRDDCTRAKAASREMVAQSIEAAGVHERTAQRLMRLARSTLLSNSDHATAAEVAI